ncbi:sensor histidine kinase [Streptococcus pyogenes]|uniref:sensor histidine kinase n=1 Tax=Streptococcus pyogenes TaxID=1314 RepID=UPI00109C9D59|nr:sensor histidine kinase [Streptococcus pyogenes]VHG68287.1 Sensor kinase dpiB [Streptococcus pyogenes]HEQ9666261.1 sensor histidine kinase [Streptococcus pyogenes]
MKKPLRLWASLSLILVSMIVVTTSLFYGIMLHDTHQSIKNQETHLLTSTGKMLASHQAIKELLLNNQPNAKTTAYTNSIASIYNLDYVVVMNMKGIRLTHPNPKNIGKPFQGGDEEAVLAGKKVISTAKGTLGKSLRYLVPVFDSDKQIGAIAVGIKLTTLNDVALTSKRNYTLSLLLCLLISLLVTSFISFRLKRQLHQLEPSEIYQLFEERNAMLDQIEAAVFVVDKAGILQLCNQAGQKLIARKCQLEKPIGKPFKFLFPSFPNLQIQEGHEQLFRYGEEDYLLAISSICVKNDHRGHIIFMREAVKAIDTLDQLAYTTAYASALQAQTHKFMNQLYVIYGLVDIAYYDQLKIYLNSILEPENEILTSLSVLVKEPLLASFLIGEQEKYQELNVHLKIDVLSEIPHSATKNQLNNGLMIYRFIHTNLLTTLRPKSLVLSIQHDQNHLISHYTLTDNWIDLERVQPIFDLPYFQQLLTDTNSKFHQHQTVTELQFSVTTPYVGGQHERFNH